VSLTINPIALLKDVRAKAMGFFFTQRKTSQPSQTVSVDLGQSHLMVLGLEKKNENLEIKHFYIEPRPGSLETTSERLHAIFKQENLDSKNVRVGLNGQGVVVRILNFPQMKKDDFASAIRYEIEKYIPFKSSEVIIDFQILKENISGPSGKMMEVLLVAAKQSEVYQLLRVLQNADIETKQIDVSAFAIANFLEYLLPEAREGTIGFLDMGTEATIFGILSMGKPVFIREISFGGVDIVKLLKRKLGLEQEAVRAMQRDASKATPDFHAVVNQALESFLNEVKLSLGYYVNHIADAKPLQSLYLMGGGSHFVSDLNLLEGEVKVPVRHPEIFPRVVFSPHLDADLLKKNEDILPVALGLCLRP